jgi:cyclopropane-fatty-acyl-phospholipid synthase
MNYVNDKFQQSFQIIAEKFLSKIRYGELIVTFPSGVTKSFKGISGNETADLKLNNYKFISKILKRKSIGFAESYMDGDFSSSDLTKLLVLSFKNEKDFLHNLKSNIFFNIYSKFKHFLNENTKKQSKKNIEYHYDLGNTFYDKWLDQSMTYSSAYFEQDNQNLFDAQISKYHQIAKSLNLNENSMVLEIGCGWGGFSSYIAKNFKSKIDAITISKEQFEYASNRIQQEGLGEKVSIKYSDYRDIENKYSNIASIEMFEAVGKKYWEKYFSILKKSLVNSGKAALQIITIDDQRAIDYQHQPDFIQQYIFPGGMLPTKKELEEINFKVGLEFKEINSFGLSYAKTLNLWNKQFQNSWEDLAQLGFNKRFKRMWEFYLSYCETGFISKSTDVSHFLINK